MNQAMVSSRETNRMHDHPNRILGIDFSGALNAANRIWIAIGSAVGNTLRLEDCRPLKDLLKTSIDRNNCLAVLRHFISGQGVCLCGMDFPFGLPRELVKEASWEEFVLHFGDDYHSPEEFREACLAAAKRHECRRATDEESKTPFSPYNIRVFRQTYFGIRDVLAPLVKDQLACILPMQKPSRDKPWIIEVCPASTLKDLGLYLRYKGATKENSEARADILSRIEERSCVLIQTRALESRVVDDQHGDALDCIIAAVASCRSLNNPISPHILRSQIYALEGYVYV